MFCSSSPRHHWSTFCCFVEIFEMLATNLLLLPKADDDDDDDDGSGGDDDAGHQPALAPQG